MKQSLFPQNENAENLAAKLGLDQTLLVVITRMQRFNLMFSFIAIALPALRSHFSNFEYYYFSIFIFKFWVLILSINIIFQ